MKNNIEKENRKKYLSPEPLLITGCGNKEFDNYIDFRKYLLKHKDKPNGPYFLRVEFYETEDVDYNVLYFDSFTPEEIIEYVEKNAYNIADYPLRLHIVENRKETAKEIKERFKWIDYYQSMNTRELLGRRRFSFRGIDVCDKNILLAILDTREHVPTGRELKQIRQEKAKLQRTR